MKKIKTAPFDIIPGECIDPEWLKSANDEAESFIRDSIMYKSQ